MKPHYRYLGALLCLTGAITVGCVAGPDVDTTDDVTDVTEPDDGEGDLTIEEPAPDAESWNGKCCHFRCTGTGGLDWYSSEPVYGQCVNYAQFWCASKGHGSYKNGSAFWGSC